jgi:hypothetical protein
MPNLRQCGFSEIIIAYCDADPVVRELIDEFLDNSAFIAGAEAAAPGSVRTAIASVLASSIVAC